MFRSSHLLAVVMCLGLFTACSAAESLPVVDDATFPASVAKDGTGNYTMTGNVTAHAGAGVAKIGIHLHPQGAVVLQDAVVDVSTATSPYPIGIVIPGAVPAGTYTYDVSATDKNAKVSAALTKTVVLQ